ncbi:flagellar export chaperone FlgN [Planctomycetota bacterium]|nr:flagellar export chaperone FlgN [Planctomycetota bacterium]
MLKTLEPHIKTLDLILQKQLQLNVALLDLLEQKRTALREANTKQMNDVCELEKEKVKFIKQLEGKRQQVVSNITRQINPAAKAPMTMHEIAKHIGGPIGDRLMLRRAQVRKKMTEVRDQASITKRATESLMRHMQSIVRTVAAASTGTASYGDRGVMNTQGMTLSTVNMTA